MIHSSENKAPFNKETENYLPAMQDFLTATAMFPDSLLISNRLPRRQYLL
jgi:hypothetical protein